MSALEIENLSFDYPDGQPALRQVSLRVGPGECLGIVGPNGAGKSTLLLHCAGLLFGQGEIRVLEEPMEPRTARRIRQRVGLVFQDPDDQLFMPRVFDDVAFGPLCRKEPMERVEPRVARALAQVDLEGFEGRLTHRLSIGEKKRVAIATVLAMDCEILLLDEPTANLDPRARRNLMVLIQKTLPQTKIVVSHDLEVIASLCHRVLLLDRGVVVTSGPTEDILRQEELLEDHGLEVTPWLCWDMAGATVR